MPPKKNATLAKHPEDSSVTFDESEDMYFRFSKLEGLVIGFVSKGDLDKRINNLRGHLEKIKEGIVKTMNLISLEERIEEKMGQMKADIVESIFKLLQNSEDQPSIVEDVGQGALEDKYHVLLGQSSIIRCSLRGFHSNTGSN